MTTPSARRPRRRQQGSTLARPAPGAAQVTPAPSAGRIGSRVHHVKNDYSYVRTDLLGIAAVGVVVLGFIAVMAFVFN